MCEGNENMHERCGMRTRTNGVKCAVVEWVNKISWEKEEGRVCEGIYE